MRGWCCSAVFIAAWIAVAIPAGAAEYYVSPGGNDTSGDGSQARPWRTIQKAADTMSAGDTCHVLDGEYAEMVRPARSGTAGQYISFVAEGSSVRVNGTRAITGWTVHSGNIWKASAPWDFGELFVDRQRMVLARWPNLTSGDLYRPNFYQATANGGRTSIIDADNLTQPSGYWTGAKIYLLAGLGWSAEQLDVTAYDPASHRVAFSTATFAPYYDADEYSLYFLYDKLSLLDAPSEWFLDRAADVVYVWLPNGDNPNTHPVEASGGSGGFDLAARSYIRVAGFKLMSGDIRMLNATGCLVEGVQHLYPAAELSVSGSDNVITRSEIAYASYTAVRLAGTRNTLSRSHVHHANYFGSYNAIVELGNRDSWPSGGSQNSIVDCSLHDTGRDGVSIVGALNVSGCTIEHNEIYNTGLITRNCGGFDTSGSDGGGTAIRHNIVHDIWPKQSPQHGSIRLGYGIYLGNNSSNFLVHHNVVYRVPGPAIMLNQPSWNNLVYNNTAVGSDGGWKAAILSSGQVDGVVVANNLAVILDGRLGWDGLLGWAVDFEQAAPSYHHNGYYNPLTSTRLNNHGVEATGVTGDPLFSNVAANDFSLLAGSPMLDRGEEIPGITDGYVGAAPDIGAYERGGSERPGPRLPTPVVTWATPASIVSGTPLSATQLNATANVPATFVYTPAAATMLAAGTHTLSVTCRPTDATNYTTATKTVTIVVAPAEYYVSPGGNDASGDGSQARPWRTIQKAADTMSAGDTCHVLDGEYAEMVRPARSGTAGQYISFVAEGSSVRVNGARAITGWTVHSGNIWKASATWDFGELFVDRQRMVLARWPNLTSGDLYRPNFYQATANGGKTSIIDAVNLTQPSGDWTGAKIFMVPGLGWTADQRDVTGYDAVSHKITFSPAISFSDYYDADEYSLYFLYDKLSLLDAPSEWFLDRAADVVYVWLPNGDNPSAHLVEGSGGSGGFDLTSRSYIRVTGFKLMSGDIKMLNATGCLVEGVQHLYPAAELLVSGSDNVITRSEIAYASYTGVRLAGTRNTLSKSHVHHTNYWGTYNSLVELGNPADWPNGGSQNAVVDCSLHDTGRDGVAIPAGLTAGGSLIEHNEIYNAGLIAKDCGGFYTWGSQGGGTVIRYNIVHDNWPNQSPQYGTIRLGYGIYLDNNSSDFLVHHNLVYRVPAPAIMLNQPSWNNLVYNNTAVGSGGGWKAAVLSTGQVDGVVVANNLAVILDGRLGWDGLLGWAIDFEQAAPSYHHNGYYNPLTSTRLNNHGVEATGVTSDPLFSNAAANDFSLLAGSPMLDGGAVIAGITDGYVGAAPDIGAYERGGSQRPGPRLPTPVVTWATPASIVYGTPLSATQLNATANVPGTFVYTPAAATVLAVGTHTLWVTCRPTDATNYTTATKTVTIVVVPLPTVSVSPSTLRFAGTNTNGILSPMTPAQTVTVSFSGAGATAWAASANQSWVQIAGGTGTGSGTFTVGIINPGNVLVGTATSAAATITVAAADASNSPQTVSVLLTLRPDLLHQPPVGLVSSPAQNAQNQVGAIPVTGWVVDDVGVKSVKVYRNCLAFESQTNCVLVNGATAVFVGHATLVAGARPDIELVYPTYPQNYQAAWGYMLLTNLLPHLPSQEMFGGQGPLTLSVLAEDVEGHQRWLGRNYLTFPTEIDQVPTQITMANDTIAKPFGAIDEPAQGATKSGVFYNTGWTLTPDSNTTTEPGDILMPVTGATQWVWIDGALVAPLTVYGHCRGTVQGPVSAGFYCDDDVSSIFGNSTPLATFTPRSSNPTKYRNLDAGRGAIGAYLLDTRTLSNGIHTIMWGVTDSAGRGDGIGSRYFTVLNASADAVPTGSARDGGTLSGDAPTGRDHLRQGYGGPPELYAKADASRPDAAKNAATPAQDLGRVGGTPVMGSDRTAAEAGLWAAPAQSRGDASTLDALQPATGEVWGRTGFDIAVPYATVAADQQGVRHVQLPDLGRLELWLGQVERGYLVANGTLRDLPIGSRLDPATGQFSWAPGVGYRGTYRLVFVRGSEQIVVEVTILPQSSIGDRRERTSEGSQFELTRSA